MNPVDTLIAALEERGLTVRGSIERGFTAQCPSHDDRNASLSINEGNDGRALVHCHTCCTFEDIVDACGLEERDLFPSSDDSRTYDVVPAPRPAQKPDRGLALDDAHMEGWAQRLQSQEVLARLYELRGWTPDALARLDVGYDGERVTFATRDASGALVGLCRYAPNPAKRNGTAKMLAAPGSLRGLFPSPESIDSDEVWIVEGEPDAVSAHTLGLPAVAIPGVDFRFADHADLFARFRRVNVLLDCDAPGRAAAAAIAATLANQGVAVYLLDLDESRDNGYDLGDLLREAAEAGPESIADARERLERMAARANPFPAGAAGTIEDWPPLRARDLPPFPVDSLPRPVAEWVASTAEHTQTPVDLPALAALGTLSGAAIGGAVMDCGGWTEELALYLLPAMRSGDRKSTVLRAAVQPLRALEKELSDEAAPRVRELRSRREVLEQRMRKLTKVAADHADIEERLAAERDLAPVRSSRVSASRCSRGCSRTTPPQRHSAASCRSRGRSLCSRPSPRSSTTLLGGTARVRPTCISFARRLAARRPRSTGGAATRSIWNGLSSRSRWLFSRTSSNLSPRIRLRGRRGSSLGSRMRCPKHGLGDA